MTEYALENDFRLGRLLVDLDLVTRTRVEQAAVLSSLTTLPLGKLLSMLDYVPERLIKSTIEAQSLLRDRLIKLDLAKKAMYLVRSSGISFGEALRALGFENPGTRRSRLGELLTDSKKIGSEQLEFGLAISNSSGLPLGQVFILMNKITEDFLRVALALQRELRRGNIERPRVIARLATADQADETANSLPSLNSERTKLGELLVSAGIIEEEKLIQASEISASLNMLLGEFLIQKSVIERDVLTLALKLQSLNWQGKISLAQGAGILKDATNYLSSDDFKIDSNGSVSEMDERAISLFNFFRLSGYLSASMLHDAVEKLKTRPRLMASVMKHAETGHDTAEGVNQEATRLALKDPRTLRMILNEIYPEDRPIVDSGLVLHKLVQDGKMSLKEALFNFSIKRSGIDASFDN
ncbi:MAG: hypothetical protein H6677_18595 [Candidatus Obscuribacterales bacterium]|nr:hypothetical protein [Cyanobacteria bacterium HKST-UBA01]MCB9470288.1 hypothetical protein [Candidatus Obscuribacterales bacterium]